MLETLYLQVREYREGENKTISRHKVFEQLQEFYPEDWLLSVELYELAKNNGDDDFSEEILNHLESVKRNRPTVGHLIDDGISLVNDALVK